MVVMKRYIVILCCLLLNICQAMEVSKLEAIILRPIDEKDLPNLIGKRIQYPVEEPLIINNLVTNQKTIKMVSGILGEKAFDNFYRIYCDETKKKGIARPSKELYYAENDNT